MELVLLEIYDQYYDRLKMFIMRHVKDEWIAEDLIQETFIRIQKNFDSVQDPSKVSFWIFRIAYNLCQDHFKSMKMKDPDMAILEDNLPGPFVEIQVQKELEQLQMGPVLRSSSPFSPNHSELS
jgi:RNA polymerase sigma factor (sigma-70 family)